MVTTNQPTVATCFKEAKQSSFFHFKTMLSWLKTTEEKEEEEGIHNFTPLQSLFLIERYPFLLPWQRWTGQPMFNFFQVKEDALQGMQLTHCPDPLLEYEATWTNPAGSDYPYDKEYVYNELDDIPFGWEKRFGLEMIEDINNLLLVSGDASIYETYRIDQIKEKYGTLRYYDHGAPETIEEAISGLVDIYEYMSARTCIVCGNPHRVVMDGRGWISPYCDKHLPVPATYEEFKAEELQQEQEKNVVYPKTMATTVCYTAYESRGDKFEPVPHYMQELVDRCQDLLGDKTLQAVPLLEETLAIENEEHDAYYAE